MGTGEQRKPLPFFDGQRPDNEELGGASPSMINLLKDGDTDWCQLWPGTSEWSDLTTAYDSPVIGMSEFNGWLMFVTSDRQVRATRDTLVVTLYDGTAATLLDGDKQPMFAKDLTRVFIAGGGVISYWDGLTSTLSRLAAVAYDAGPPIVTPSDPPITTHLANVHESLLAIPADNSGTLVWTEFDEESHITGWQPIDFAGADSRPDPCVALHDNASEVFVFGKESIDIFRPDPNSGFSYQSSSNVGCAAAYSIIKLADIGAFAWLTQDKELVIGDARTAPKFISREGISTALRGLSDYSDCVGSRLKFGQHDALVWKFPLAGRTFAYDLVTSTWIDLRGWSDTTGDFVNWPIISTFYWPDKNLTLCGLSDGTIVKLDNASSTQAGQRIVGENVTAFVDHGAKITKQTKYLRFPMRRGVGTFGGTPPVVQLSYRDNLGPFQGPVRLSLGNSNDREIHAERRIIGRPYIARQWKVRVTDGVSISLGKPEETFEVLQD